VNIVGCSFEELMAMFLCDLANNDDYYAIIAYHLIKDYRPQLESMLPLLSPKRQRAALCGIGLVGSPASDELVKEYLGHAEPLVVAEALDALRLGSEEWERVATFLAHPSPFVRGAALRFARARLGENARPLLLAALTEDDEIMKQNALDELEGIADRSHLSLIVPLLQDASAYVRQAAASLIASIDSLTGNHGI
jgi:HEAT repeat protein